MEKIKNIVNRLTREQRILIIVITAVLAAMIIVMIIISGIISSGKNVPALADEVIVASVPERKMPEKCEYIIENIETREGFKYYYEEGRLKSHVGIDVSFAQKEIDWKAVSDAGVEFAMVRAGYRGYETGILHKDEFFDRNMSGIMDTGIEAGVYFFSQAVTPEEAAEEAQYVLKLIEKYNVTYPIAFDWEPITGNAARTDSISGDKLNDIALAFCEEIQKAGYMPVIYASLNLLREQYGMYDAETISGYDLWLAEYKDLPEYPYKFRMWQYASDGAVAGINTAIDLNVYFE